MKKSIVLLILFIIVFMSACTGENRNSNNVKFNDKDTLYSVSQDIVYLTFEETIDAATNIVQAKYIEMEDLGTYYELLFNIEKQYKGNITEDYLYVYCEKSYVNVPEKGYIFDNLGEYITGKSYILLLERHVSVYYEHDMFLILSPTDLPVDTLKDLHIYGQETLTAHSSITESDTVTFQQFESYITNKVEESPLQGKSYYGTAYIDSSDIEIIVKDSDYVVRLKPKTQGDVLASGKTAIYDCEVIKQYKGILDTENIRVKFLLNTVDINSEYIVAINDSAVSGLYILSSKNSVMSVDRENQILSLIDYEG